MSRQPVRNAFTRLGNEELLLIRPQKATVVRGFSMERVQLARFIRLSIELEVTRSAILLWNAECNDKMKANLVAQENALNSGDLTKFHALDYGFHKLICTLGQCPLAFEVIQDSKQKVDRLCVLSLSQHTEAGLILKDHKEVAAGLASGDLEKALATTRKHLSRLDDTIDFIHQTHPDYFE